MMVASYSGKPQKVANMASESMANIILEWVANFILESVANMPRNTQSNQFEARRHERTKFFNQFQVFINHVGGSVSSAALEALEQVAVGQNRQTLGCHGRTAGIAKEPFRSDLPARPAGVSLCWS